MDTVALKTGPVAGNTSFDVLLRATVMTRFKVKDRWVIAGTYQEENAAQREFGQLSREFPPETVNLVLVRCDSDDDGGNYRERVLDSRGKDTGGRPKRARLPAPAPSRAASPARAAAPDRGRPVPQPVQAPSGNAALHWQLAAGLVLATLLLTILLR